MLISIPEEASSSQTLVAATPDTVAKLIGLGYEVQVEAGAGLKANYYDEQYREAGASIVDDETAWSQTDIVVCLDTPPARKRALLPENAVLMCRMNPGAHSQLVQDLAEHHITGLAIDAVPRISRAQALDVRSSMANVGGYRAVIEAAHEFGRLFSGQITAAGKVPPARVYVIGVGVAGLAAIGIAQSMGAQVFATDVRAEVADQVESLGASFVEIPVKQESKDGYAKELDDDQQKRVLEVYAEQAAKSDIIITTAQIPGKPSPLLLTAEAVLAMKPGSVIVDMGASDAGSNCALTKPGEVTRTENGVTIIGYTDLPRRMPAQASQLYGQNVVNFFKLATPEKDGQLVLNEDDVIIRGITVSLDGQVMWPPPEVSVSAAGAGKGGAGGRVGAHGAGAAGGASEKGAAQTQEGQVAAGDSAALAEDSAEANTKEGLSTESKIKDEFSTTSKAKEVLKRWWWKVAAGVLGVALVMGAPPEMAEHFVVFGLACVVGFYVITNVTHTLHTPLMSVTNAISGIIIVGALLQIGSENPVVVVLSFAAIVIASINIFGGFLVTRRMLAMFERSSEE